MKHFISIAEHDADRLRHVLHVGRTLRGDRDAGRSNESALAGQTLAMLFEKPSLRTRVSFAQAMNELGGHALSLQQGEVGLGERETPADVARVLSGMVHGIAARVFEHDKLVAMTHAADVPVINMLSDFSHPCQALADVMTAQDEFGEDLTDRTFAFVGDGNNVARSLASLCAKLGARFVLSAPSGYRFSDDFTDQLQCLGAEFESIDDPHTAVEQADVIYTDTWVSMGQEEEKAQRLAEFAGYRVDESLLAAAPPHAIVQHCLPAYRGVEITDAVMDGPQSRVFQQAHNRLHAQKGLLAVLMGGM
ncbi:MAG: ornithine carbamoyltransferase [Planctomycetaceae bacterium]|nr:ornithine carbamoyltransferase [Planctomycetaceae bacterium]